MLIARGRKDSRFDIRDRMDWRVPGDAVLMRFEHLPCVLGDRWILDPCLWKGSEEQLRLQMRVGRLPEWRGVLGLEVGGLNGSGRGDLIDQLLVPV